MSLDKSKWWLVIALVVGVALGFLGSDIYQKTLIGEGPLVAKGPGVTVVYETPEMYHKELEEFFAETRVLEDMAEMLNTRLSNPPEFELWVGNCGEANAYYSQSKNKIILCYEFLIDMADSLKEEQDIPLLETINNTLYFALFHEMGHALIDKYKLPATGKEEDAVDQLAIMIFAENDMIDALNASVHFFKRRIEHREANNLPDATSYWDDHGLDQQRFYNILCWIYGSDKEEYAAIVEDGHLPESRASSCEYEYYRLEKSWKELLNPHLNDKKEYI